MLATKKTRKGLAGKIRFSNRGFTNERQRQKEMAAIQNENDTMKRILAAVEKQKISKR